MVRLPTHPALMTIQVEVLRGAEFLPVEELLQIVVGRINGRLSLLREIPAATREWNLDVHRRLLQGAARDGKVTLLTMARMPMPFIRADSIISLPDARRHFAELGVELVEVGRQTPEVAAGAPDPMPPGPDAPDTAPRRTVLWRIEAAAHLPAFIKAARTARTAHEAGQFIRYLRSHAADNGVILAKVDAGKLWWRDATGCEQSVGVKTVQAFMRERREHGTAGRK